MGVEDHICQYEERSYAFLGHRRKRTVKVTRIASLQELKLYAQRLGRNVHFLYRELMVRVGWVRQDSHTAGLGNHLLEKLQLFGDAFQAGVP